MPIHISTAYVNNALSPMFEETEKTADIDLATLLASLPPSLENSGKALKASQIQTKVGRMIAIADDDHLYLLEFFGRKHLTRQIARLQLRGFTVHPGANSILCLIERELQKYFDGNLAVFETPLQVFGSPFQQQVWQALGTIPYGETWTYAQQASYIGKPGSYRAVANANGTNQFAIVVPCHRVIASNGTLGGYGGGIPIKQQLLRLEKQHAPTQVI